MNWQKPEFTQINMSAEIGGYQSDDDHGGIPDPLAVDASGARGGARTQPPNGEGPA